MYGCAQGIVLAMTIAVGQTQPDLRGVFGSSPILKRTEQRVSFSPAGCILALGVGTGAVCED